MAACVDKPRKEEAAGGLDQAMGKVRCRSGPRLRLARGWRGREYSTPLESWARLVDLLSMMVLRFSQVAVWGVET